MFYINAFEQTLHDFICMDFGSRGSMQLNANKAMEDKFIYDAKIESQEKAEDGRLSMINILNKKKALEEREENPKAVFDINVFKPLQQNFGCVNFGGGGSE